MAAVALGALRKTALWREEPVSLLSNPGLWHGASSLSPAGWRDNPGFLSEPEAAAAITLIS